VAGGGGEVIRLRAEALLAGESAYEGGVLSSKEVEVDGCVIGVLGAGVTDEYGVGNCDC
jgi:hypothetical protein